MWTKIDHFPKWICLEVSFLPVSCVLWLPCWNTSFLMLNTIRFVMSQILSHMTLGVSAGCEHVLRWRTSGWLLSANTRTIQRKLEFHIGVDNFVLITLYESYLFFSFSFLSEQTKEEFGPECVQMFFQMSTWNTSQCRPSWDWGLWNGCFRPNHLLSFVIPLGEIFVSSWKS